MIEHKAHKLYLVSSFYLLIYAKGVCQKHQTVMNFWFQKKSSFWL